MEFKDKGIPKLSDGYKMAKLPNMDDLLGQQFKDMERMDAAMREITRENAIKEAEKEEREKQLNEMIKQIAENTSFIPNMVDLVRKNNEINEEVLELYKDMANVLKAKTKEEAEGKVIEIAEKAKNTKDALDTITGLYNYGKVLIKLMFPEG